MHCIEKENETVNRMCRRRVWYMRRQVMSDLSKSWGVILKAVVTVAHYRNLEDGSVDTYFLPGETQSQKKKKNPKSVNFRRMKNDSAICKLWVILFVGDAFPGMGGLGIGLSESFLPVYSVSLVINCTQMWISCLSWRMQAITRKIFSFFKASHHSLQPWTS